MLRRLVFLALFASFAACGDDHRVADAGLDCGHNSWCDYPDARPKCDPFTQAGCGPGERCTAVGRLIAYCTSDGTVPEGGACEFSPESGPDTLLVDNCQAGNYCFDGVCMTLCDLADNNSTVCDDGIQCTNMCIRVLTSGGGSYLGSCLELDAGPCTGF